jgi:hypothetical protein
MLLQLLRITVLGTTHFLRGIVLSLSDEAHDKLDRLTRKAARRLLFLAQSTPIALIDAHCGLPRAAAVTARDRERFALLMAASPADSIAGSITRGMLAAGPSAPKECWARLAAAQRAIEAKLHIPRPRADLVGRERRRAPALYSRRYSHVYARTQRRVDDAARVPAMRGDPAPSVDFRQLPAAPPRQAVLFAALRFPFDTSRFGADPHMAPLSAIGSGTRGSLLVNALVPTHVVSRLLRLATGRPALGRRPFSVRPRPLADAPARAHVPARALGAPPKQPPLFVVQFANGGSCRLCGAPDEGPLHALLLCPNARLLRPRAALLASAASIYDRVVATAYRLSRKPRLAPAAPAPPPLDWSSAEGSAILFRLLCGLPWPARAAVTDTGAALPHAERLGLAFDVTIAEPAETRGLATAVARWAYTHVTAIGRAWNDAIGDARPLDAPAPPAPPAGALTSALSARYRLGGAATDANLPPLRFPRWQGRSYLTCEACDGDLVDLFAADKTAIQSCALCDLSRHTDARCTRAARTRPLAPDEVWVCAACCVSTAYIARTSGHPAVVALSARPLAPFAGARAG